MGKKLIKAVIYRTIVFVVALIIPDFLLKENGYIRQFFELNISFMLNPLQYLIVLIYIASVLNLILKGTLSAATVSNIKIFAIGIFIYLILSNPPTPERFSQISFWILIGTIILIFKRTANAISKSFHANYLKTLSTTISLLALGYISKNVIQAFSDIVSIGPFSSLETIVFYSFVTVSAFSLLGILAGINNSYLSYIGKKFASSQNLFSTFSLILITLIYFFNFRPILLNNFPNYVMSAEWAIVCFSAFIIYLNFKSHIEETVAEDIRLGKWTRLFQKIVYKKDEVELTAKTVKEFVEEGFKEGILVQLISTLLENNVQPSEIETVISELVDYKDIPNPKLTFTWRLKNLEVKNRNRRLRVLARTLSKAANLLHMPTTTDEKELAEVPQN